MPAEPTLQTGVALHFLRFDVGLSLSDVQAPNGPELSRNKESKPGTNSFAPFGFAEHKIEARDEATTTDEQPRSTVPIYNARFEQLFAAWRPDQRALPSVSLGEASACP